MEVLREGQSPTSSRASHTVSILVLMEVLREAKIDIIMDISPRSFNPCFNGSVERGKSRSRKISAHSMFQSLF